jgi:hypothetical protein
MSYLDDLGEAPGITPGDTSYFSSPSSTLDPHIFEGDHLKSWVKSGILSMLFDYLGKNYTSPQLWAHVWLAGSGVSYQWEASRSPGDLDCLVGINYVKFRELNSEFSGYSDQEIASTFNEGFTKELMPNTSNWEGYELTYYVNPQSDIRDINPYAAYDLTSDSWTVKPEQSPQPPYSRDWEQRTQRDHSAATEYVNRYSNALNEIRSASNPAHRVSAERKLNLAMEQAIGLFDEIHSGRKIAFSKVGAGYSDFNNYRWQAGKRSGAINALKSIKEKKKLADSKQQQEIYGMELPNTDTLIRRSLRG